MAVDVHATSLLSAVSQSIEAGVVIGRRRTLAAILKVGRVRSSRGHLAVGVLSDLEGLVLDDVTVDVITIGSCDITDLEVIALLVQLLVKIG